jgi:hypothetical protein
MDLFKTDKFVTVTAQNTESLHTLSLTYRVYDIDIVDRWLSLIEKNNVVNNKLRYNYRKILSREEIETKFQKFKSNIEYINKNYDRQLTDIVNIEYLRSTPHILNDLHEEYEIYGDRLERLIRIGYFNDPIIHDEYYNEPWPGSKNENDKVLHEAFLLLNEQIHNFEMIFKTWDEPTRTLCTGLVDFIPAGMHENLRPEDYFLFTPDHEWGCAYLGYNTLGKHWSSVYRDNDIEVVKRDAVRPQRRFAAEMYMNFGSQTQARQKIEFYQWWTTNNIGQYCDARMRLEDFAMGFIPVARLASYKFEDQEIIKISPNISREDKLAWNNDVWSKFNSIIDLRVISK